MSIDYGNHVETGDEIPEYPYTNNESMEDQFCSSDGRACNCASPFSLR